MPKYPNWAVGLDVSAANLALMLPNITVKSAAQSRSATTTFQDDSELVNIPLAVGTHWVRLLLLPYTNTSATPDIKTSWVFTGTWNDPGRARIGPSSTNTGSPSGITPMLMGVTAASLPAAYGLASGTTPYAITEECFNVVVTVAGNLSLQWAQNTSDASNTTVAAGTTFETRQLA